MYIPELGKVGKMSAQLVQLPAPCFRGWLLLYCCLFWFLVKFCGHLYPKVLINPVTFIKIKILFTFFSSLKFCLYPVPNRKMSNLSWIEIFTFFEIPGNFRTINGGRVKSLYYQCIYVKTKIQSLFSTCMNQKLN